MNRTKRKYTRRVQVYETEVNENITRQYWYIISMIYTVIHQVNIPEKYQQEILVFTDHKGRLIGDGDVDLTGVKGWGWKVGPTKI